LLLLLLALGPAAAEVPWTPPPVGLTVDYAAAIDGAPLELTQTVTGVEGDIVLVSGSSPAHQEERYFRFLAATQSGGNSFVFDSEALAALWPLTPGKSVSLPVAGKFQGRPLVLQFDATVEALETLSVPAGSFATVRIRHRLAYDAADAGFVLDTVTWLDQSQGFPVRTETLLTATGAAPIKFALEARRVR